MADLEPELTAQTQALLAQARALQPPAGARERVLAGATQAIAPGRHGRARKLVLWAGAPALAVLAAAALSWLAPGEQAPSARVLGAVDAGTADGQLRAGDGLRDQTIAIGPRGQLRVALAQATVGVQGPARVELVRGALVVHEGTAEVDGLLPVRGASCRATVHGRCALARTGEQLQITVFAGSVQVDAPEVACSIVDLTSAPAHGGDGQAPRVSSPAPVSERVPPAKPAIEQDPPARAGATAPRATRPRPAAPQSELALQVQAYREGLALRGRDDARAIEVFREMNRRWPRSPLRHEIDLNVVDALVRAGRSAEATMEARRFLARHPHSTKADEMRKSLGGAAPAAAPDVKNTIAK